MRQPRNLYKNRLGIPWLSFTVIAGLITLTFGCAYVYLKNQHVLGEGEKHRLAIEIEEFGAEIGGYENQILMARTPGALLDRLGRIRSELVQIPAGVSVTVGGNGTESAMAKADR